MGMLTSSRKEKIIKLNRCILVNLDKVLLIICIQWVFSKHKYQALTHHNACDKSTAKLLNKGIFYHIGYLISRCIWVKIL